METKSERGEAIIQNPQICSGKAWDAEPSPYWLHLMAWIPASWGRWQHCLMIGISIFSQVSGLETFASGFCPRSLEVQGETEIPKLAAVRRKVEDSKGRGQIKRNRETVNKNIRVYTGFPNLPWERQSLPHSLNNILFQKAKQNNY